MTNLLLPALNRVIGRHPPGLATSSPFVANSVHLDGVNDNLISNSLVGAVDSNRMAGSVWVRRTGGIGNVQRFLASTSTNSEIQFGADDRLRFILRNEAGVEALDMRTSPISDDEYHHVAWSLDLDEYGDVHLLVDGADDLSQVDTREDLDIDFTVANWAVGSTTGGSSRLDADLAVLQVWFGTYVDLSVLNNIRQFISPSGRPVDPANAAAAFGDPIILLDGPTDTWHTNQGTGGGFSEVGELTDGQGPVILAS